MSDSIPIELQMEIVKRVPVKSLFQFRSVSKLWKSLIDSSQFIADYNACESRPQPLLIRYEDVFPKNEFEYYPKHYASVCIVDDDIFPQNKFPTTVSKIFQLFDEQILVGSSQGLFCFGDYFMALLWNPAIRKSIAIDVPGSSIDIYTTVLGFGVCPNTNDPMLVKFDDYYDGMYWRVKVFTLSSRVWRRPRGNQPRSSIVFAWSQVVINGFIYWKTFSRLIVSFDMTNEEFAEIDLPLNLTYPPSKDLSICNLRESLAVLEYSIVDEKPVCVVWMMEHGVPKPCTKLFTVPIPNACLMRVLGFRKNGEAILEVNKSTDDFFKPAELEVYEPHSELIKDLGIQGKRGSFSVTSYKETLLLHDKEDNLFIHMKVLS